MKTNTLFIFFVLISINISAQTINIESTSHEERQPEAVDTGNRKPQSYIISDKTPVDLLEAVSYYEYYCTVAPLDKIENRIAYWKNRAYFGKTFEDMTNVFDAYGISIIPNDTVFIDSAYPGERGISEHTTTSWHILYEKEPHSIKDDKPVYGPDNSIVAFYDNRAIMTVVTDYNRYKVNPGDRQLLADRYRLWHFLLQKTKGRPFILW